MVGRKDLRRRPFSALIIKGIEVTLPALRRDDDVADPPCAGGLRRSVAMPRHGVTRTATRIGRATLGGEAGRFGRFMMMSILIIRKFGENSP
jgi:hypothetical protein